MYLRLTLALASLTLVPAASAQAGMGFTELPGLQGDGTVTLFYPTAAAEAPLQRGPFTLSVAQQAEPQRGNGHLVIISHGSGGAPWVHTDLARALVEAGFTVAMPQHAGDNYQDTSTPGPQSWRNRPAEVSRAIDAVAQAQRFAPLLALDRVGVFGQSAGGHTALSLAGGQWSPQRFLRHCQAHIADDFNACVGTFTRLTGGWFDGLKKAAALGVLRQRFDDPQPVAYHDPRIVAAVAGVPAAADFDMDTLRQPRIPLGLVTAGQDIWLTPRWHGEAVAQACGTCEHIAHLPEAGHNAMLSPLPPARVLGNVEAVLLADPPGFDRSSLAALDLRITAFFRQHLLVAPQ